jgi:hypothetical protein
MKMKMTRARPRGLGDLEMRVVVAMVLTLRRFTRLTNGHGKTLRDGSGI